MGKETKNLTGSDCRSINPSSRIGGPLTCPNFPSADTLSEQHFSPSTVKRSHTTKWREIQGAKRRRRWVRVLQLIKFTTQSFAKQFLQDWLLSLSWMLTRIGDEGIAKLNRRRIYRRITWGYFLTVVFFLQLNKGPNGFERGNWFLLLCESRTTHDYE